MTSIKQGFVVPWMFRNEKSKERGLMVTKVIKSLLFLVFVSSLFAVGGQLAFGQGASATPAPTATPSPISRPGAPKIPSRRREKQVPGARRSAESPRAAKTISLWVIAKPSGSKVFVDDVLQGETNPEGELEVRLLAGTRRIRVSREGYITSLSEVEVIATPEPREVEFTLSPALSTVNIVSDPPEAEVYLDDVYKGASNANGLLVIERVNPSQQHTLRVRKDGYQQQAMPVTTYSGQIAVKLLPDSGKLKIVTDPPEAEIYLDDVYKGSSTEAGILMIEQVNPNQSHSVRAKKEGYRQQAVLVSPHSSEASIKLLADPVVVLVKSIKQHVAQGALVEAFDAYKQLTLDAPDHQEIPRLAETILQSLQVRSTDMLKRIDPYGLPADLNKAREMSRLYLQARNWRAGDETIDSFASYWTIEYLLANAAQAASVTERESLLRDAQSALSDLSERNLRNMYLLLDLGWAWLKLNNSSAAERYFNAALELKPDWSYPHFALGVLALQSADREVAKSPKAVKYAQAIDRFTKAIVLKHDFPRAYALRSIALANLKRYEESTASGLQAIALDPNSAYAHFALGFAYFQKGKSQYRSARDELNRALAVDAGELDEGAKATTKQLLAQIARAIK